MLVLHSHMPYVLSHGKSPHGTDWLMESAVECYLPILNVLDRLLAEGIKPRWTINVTPILAEQLADESFKSEFEDYCRSKIEYARQDEQKFDREGDLWLMGLASFWQRVFEKGLDQFQNRWGRNIPGGFRYFEEQGCVELITCGATHGYMPLLGTEESCQTQVKLAVETHKKHFGRNPKGIWLPECAYRPPYMWKSPIAENEEPWPRKGVEDFLQENGIDFFFVDSHMIRGGEPLGTYQEKFPQLAELFARSAKFFSPPPEFRSEYAHYKLPNGVACFSRDPQTTLKVWSGEHGYPGDQHNLEFHKMLYPGRHRYWRISADKRDLGAKQPYDPWKAYENIPDHAQDMVQTAKAALAAYRGQSERNGTLVAMYDTELFGHWWWEGTEFLYEMAKRIHEDPDLESVSGSDVLSAEPDCPIITLPEGSWGEGGYHYVWLNEDNFWTWKRLYPAQRMMRKMAREMADGPAKEIVQQAGRELLLAEASDWQFLISTFAARDYAEIRFADHVDRFERLSQIAERVHAGGELTATEQEFLEDCQQKDAPFADLDVKTWAKLDHPLPT